MDGSLDVIVAGDGMTRVYHNDGGNIFTEQSGLIPETISNNSLSAGDYNNDGFPDILLSGDGMGATKVYKNDGGTAFIFQSGISLPAVSNGSAKWGDYDNDGDLDIVIAGNGFIAIYRNNHDNTFSWQSEIELPGIAESSAEWGDSDNDGDIDLLVTGWNSTRVYRNNGDNTFTEIGGQPFHGVSWGSTSWGDYDYDGWIDILLTGNGAARVYRNNHDNTYSYQSSIILADTWNSSGTWGDFDNDGYSDILLTGCCPEGSISRVYRNNGNNTFSEQKGIILTSICNGTAVWGDYNSDGRLDILLSGGSPTGPVTKIYTNKLWSVNSVPPAPSGLSSTVNETSVLLQWSDVTGDATPANSMSYNIRVGISPGGSEIISPQSLSSGERLISANGNTQLNNQFILKNLQKGTFYWSVQAVDNGFSGGPFADEQSFTWSVSNPASGLFADSVKTSSLILNWNRGNGSACAVFAKKSEGGAALPENGTSYTANNLFGNGTQIGTSGWFCVYNGSGSSVKVTGLETLSYYTFHVIEYEAGPSYYSAAGVNNPAVLQTNAFTLRSDFSFWGLNHGSPEWCDYDRDGDLDVLLAGDGWAKIYRNEGGTDFVEQTGIIFVGVSNCAMAWEDYDLDGYPDILITGDGPSGQVSKIYRNNQDSTFSEQAGIVLQGVSNSSVAWGDYDNDGDPDILLTGRGFSQIYSNNGNNTFTLQNGIILQGVDDGSVAWGDYDHDGDLDIVLTGWGLSKIYRNNGNNTFTEQTTIILQGVHSGSAVWGDYNNDSNPDILLTGWDNTNQISKIYRNNGDNTFTDQTSIILIGVQGGVPAWGDFDNDGLTDILLSGWNSSGNVTKVYKNNGDNTFTDQTGIELPQVNNSTASWGDFNNDGKLDIFLTGNGNVGNISWIFENNMPLSNTVPSIPEGLSATSNETSITLNWNGVTGDATPAAGMSYNIRIGTTPGGSNVVSPLSLTAGTRLIPVYGNARLNYKYVLKNPEKATYYWSVQAIDNGFLAGPFAAEQSVTFSSPLQASGLFADSIMPLSLRLNWTRGNGTACVVFAKSGSTGTASPADGTTYTANSVFGSGTQIGTSGWYCVYNGTGASVKITGLEPVTNYIFQVIEYDPGPAYYTNTGQSNPIVKQTNAFAEVTGITIQGVNNNSAAWCDYDRDGDLDLLISGDGITRIYRNESSDSFSEQSGIVLLGVSNGSVSWGDYNNDGYPDILLTGYGPSGPLSKVYKNNGNNTFSDQIGITLTGVGNSSAVWGDYNNDGKIDILLSGNDIVGTFISRIYRNNGDNTFTWQLGISLVGLSESSVSWGDLDNDGDLDVLLTGSGNARLYRNNGNNTFTELTGSNFHGVSWGSTDWGDYNNDGWLDILLTGNGYSKVFINNKNGSFSDQASIILTGVSQGYGDWGDFDNDGLLDILLTGTDPYGRISKVYRNNGDYTFTELPGIVLTGVGNGTSIWGDFNKDGRLDIFLIGDAGSGNIAKIYKSFIPAVNTPPGQPSGLSAQATEESILFRWNRVAGDNTPSQGMSYNVRVGSSPGGSDIVSPMSLVSGSRLVPEAGNTGADTLFMLRNPDKGTYYWSVQAVDNGFMPGALTAEQSVVYSYSVQSSEINADSVGALDLVCRWTRGNGSGCAVFVKKGDNGAAAPQNGTSYTANSVFGNGSQIGTTGWYCVYNGTGTNVRVSGLEPATNYIFHVIEYEAGLTYYTSTASGNPEILRTHLFTELADVSLPGVGNRSSSSWCDYDKDGDLDILLTGDGISKIFRNEGGDSFSEQTGIILEGVWGAAAAWGDYDCDGYPDILITGWISAGGNASRIYRNNGNNTFTWQSSISLIGVSSGAVAWGDYDNDGDPDIVITGNRYSRIYRNNGDNTFTEQTEISLYGVDASSVEWGDYDLDGDLDLFMTGQTSSNGISRIYRNNSDNTFTEQTSIEFNRTGDGSAAWGDYNNDSYPDVLVAGFGNSYLYKNNGNNTFTWQSNIVSEGIHQCTVDWADYDNDGLLDVLLTGNDNNNNLISKVFRNTGSNSFTEQIDIVLRGVNRGSAAWGDYDNNGRLDILLTGNSGTVNIARIYKSYVASVNQAPSSPSGLMATVGESSLVFRWNRVSGDVTPAKGMTFNIRIGTTPGGSDVVPPISLTTGSRLIPWVGNNGSDTMFILRYPERSTYYWSVQAVDNGLKAGPFASEQSVTYSSRIQASQVAAVNVEANILRLEWRRGNGTAAVVFAKKGTTGTALPADGTTYSADPAFGNGTQIGTSGWYCVYNGTSSGVDISGLEPLTNYLFQAIEYDAGPSYYGQTGQANPALIMTNAFSRQTGISLQGVISSSVAWGDYDNDGDPDILLTGYKLNNERISRIYRNDGSNTFTEQTGIYLYGVQNGSADWSDYDNDGDLDILISGEGISKIYRNNGAGSFSEQTGIILPGMIRPSIGWGDFDNDGFQDILFAGHNSSWNPISKIYRNNGNNSFTEQSGISLGTVGNTEVAWGDYDNDGYRDILLGAYKVFHNNGDNTFSELTGLNLYGLNESSVSWADYNNDGFLDIFITGSSNAESFAKLYRNNGNSTFTEESGLNIKGIYQGSATWGDFDNDGNTDLLLTGGGLVKIYRNQGNNTFAEYPDLLQAGLQNSSAAWGDYDNDGRLDIIMSGQSGGGCITAIYRNIAGSANIAPEAPFELSSSIDETSVKLKWNRSTGDITPGKGMSYNVRIGTSSAAGNIISPMSLSSGARLMPAMGNSFSDTVLILRNPKKTTYYWSVQAVDNGYKGGMFAAEQSITYALSVQASNVFADSIKATAIKLHWTRGNGNGCVVFAKKSDSGASVPVNGTVYTANQVFGTGSQIGTTGWYCVYSGINNYVVVSGLEPAVNYIFHVIEYEGGPSYYTQTGQANPFMLQPSVLSEQSGISLANLGNGSYVAWCDYDRDGDPDILITGDNQARIYRNDGNNVFTEQTGVNLPGIWQGSVDWGDYDNDGSPDILIAGNNNSGAFSRIYRNAGNNTFIEQTDINLPWAGNCSAKWIDFNKDGRQDISLAGDGISGSFTRLFRNDGNNIFTEITSTGIPALNCPSTDWGDYNRDGYPDFLVSGNSPEGTISRVYRNNGNSTFSWQSEISLAGVSDGAVAWGDYDSDGLQDIVITGSGISKIYRNIGNNNFSEQTGITLEGFSNSTAAWGDYDNDGYLDLVISGWTNSSKIETKLYHNNGNNTFSEQTDVTLTDANNGAVAWGDYNNDGRLDLILSGEDESGNRYTRIFRNYSPSVNYAPAAPSGLSVTNNNKSFTLHWNRVEGDATPSHGMSYNVRIGISAGGNDVVSSMSLSSGSRLIPKSGNAWSDTLYILTNPKKATYYLGVQAVDNGFAASPFSAEQTYTFSESVQAFFITADSIQSSGIRLLWTRGNGSACAVFGRKAESGTASPVDGTVYVANSVFGTGSQIGSSGWYCVYNGTGNNLKISGLEPLTNYVFHVVEYESGPSFYTQIGQDNPLVVQTNIFTEENNIVLPGISSGCVLWGDYDNDGDLDLLLTGRLDNGERITRLYRNNNDNTFTVQPDLTLPGVEYSSAAWGDYDNDNDLDLLLSGYTNNNTFISKLFKNEGSGNLAEQTGINLLPFHQGSVAWGDYDNDGLSDILLSGNTGLAWDVRVYKNYGGNTFIYQPSIVFNLQDRGSADWGDYDNDGDLDILLTGGSSRIYCNNGDNSFTELNEVFLRGGSGGMAVWGDYDNDSDLDILLSMSGSTVVYRNIGNNAFAEQSTIILQGVHETSAAWADYDMDGNLDILMTGSNNLGISVSKIYRNNGDNTFTEQTGILLPGVNDGTVAWGDYNNDGKLDMVITGNATTTKISKIFRNDIPVPNSSPVAPAGLTAVSNETSIVFKWNRVTGDETPDRGIMYNVRIGTAPGAGDVVSPMAFSSGLRLIPGTGNAQSDTAFILRNPKKVTYYYSVQAIDNGFASGPFAAEQSITYTYSIQASQVAASDIQGSTLNLLWNRGNGSACAVFVKKGTGISAVPVDGATYTADEDFGSGSQIGATGWYCVYNGTGNKVNVKSLEALTSYTFQVLEYEADLKYNTIQTDKNPISVVTGLFDAQASISLPGLSGSSNAWGDYDNDGDVDLLVTGATAAGNISKIYRNEDNNTFTEQTEITLQGVARGSAAWGDYDNDNDLDILLTGSGFSKIYRNNGDNSFTDQTDIVLVSVQESSSAWGDYNDDGYLDILLTGKTAGGNFSKVYRNNGNNTFTEQTGILLQGVSLGSASWGDYDNDYDLDILLTGSTTGTVSGAISRLYRNNGDNTFTEQADISLYGVYENSAAWADYDNDGDLDITISGQSSIGFISRIYRNNGDYTFTYQVSISLPGFWLGAVSWGDFDNDGDPDLILAGSANGSSYGGMIRFFRNNNDNTFTETPEIVLPEIYLGSVEAGDYNSDGNLDVIISGYDHNNDPLTRIFLNRSSVVNDPPPAPSGLSASSDETSLTLNWKKGSDNITPSEAIGYNVRIGTSPGGTDIVSPMALSPGSRLLPEFGNSQSDTVFVFRAPRKTTYYWSVQAIDGAFNAGPFSAEQSYTYTISVQASQVTMEKVEGTGINLNWSRGNGSGCLVFAKKGSGGSASPGEGITYTAGSYFGSGSQIGTSGWYCVYNGTGSNAVISGLESLTTYTFHVVEYDPGPVYDIRASLGNPLVTETGLFDEQTGISLQGISQGSVAWGDYDNDGYYDVIVTGSGYSRIYRNNGDNTFALAVTLPGVFNSSAAWGDYDNDGDVDIMLTGSTSSRIYRNDGSSTFTEQAGAGLAGVSSGSSAWSDYDRDGDLDILHTGRLGSGEAITRIYLNNGDGTFTAQSRISLPNVYYSSVAWGDYDKDGLPDILITGTTNGSSSGALSKIYRNNGDNTFSEQTGIILPGVYYSSSLWFDYDADGDLDVLLTGNTGGQSLLPVSKIYRNNGENSFTEQTAINIMGVYQGSAAWGDLNNDGYADIVLTGKSVTGESISKAYLNNGENNFTEQKSITLPGVNNSSVSLCDYDRDGRPDLLVSGQASSGNISRVYRNMSTVSNNPPFTPNGLSASETENSLVLKWDMVTGDETPDKSIFYNVRIGTSPGGTDVVSPMALPSGSSLIPYSANAGSDTVFTLRYPRKTTYYWSVQAEDNSFMTSPFAAEQSFDFTISVQSSQLYAGNIQGSNLNLAWQRGNGSYCVVFAKEGTTGTATPTDGISYTASPVYGSGSEIGTSGWYCIYSGTENHTSVTGLQSVKSYILQVIEFDPGPLYYTQTGQANPVVVRTGLFSEQTGLNFPGVINGSSAWGDYDNDGDYDILITGNSTSGRISKIFRNNGDYTFSENTGVTLPVISSGSGSWGDYDNDGDLDILLTGTTNGSAAGAISKVFRNDGSGLFTEQPSVALTGVFNSYAAWGDYDNDGWLDILLTGTTDGAASGAISKIYRNNRDNTFTWQTGINLQGIHFSSAAWGDYDNDNDLDILMAGNLLSRIYSNNGNNTFTEQSGITLPGISGGSVAWGDNDNDSDLDILITGSSSSGSNSRIYRNNGDNTFTAQTAINLTAVSGSTGNWGDYDNDGLLDVAITGKAGATSADIITKFYRNNGNNSFAEQPNLSLEGVWLSSFAWGDYDNDTKSDIVLTGQNPDYVPVSRIYRNLSATANTPPSIPPGLLSVVSDTSVLFTWNKSTDDETPSGGLSYNIRIGSSPGSNDIVASMSLTAGKRLLPGTGNAQTSISFLLKYPKKGTYYWSVQAMDQGFLAGTFSEEKSFVYSASVQARMVFADNIRPTSADLHWHRGNGTACVVFACKGNSGSASPANGTVYTAGNQFGTGTQIGTSGWYCVYNGTGNNVSVTGLEPLNNYVFQVVEYEAGPEYYTNKGQGNPYTIQTDLFVEQTMINFHAVSSGSAAWGDFDNDNDLDLLITGSSVSKIYRNNDNNTFTEMAAISLMGVANGSSSWGDYDNDGDLDILLTGGNNSRIYRNDANSTFTEQSSIILPGVTYSSAAWGNYDSDGYLDILITGRLSSQDYISRIYKNNRNNSFTEQTGIVLTGVNNSSVAWGDYDNDSYPDILLTGNSTTGPVSKIYRNNKDNTFTEQAGIALEEVAYSSAAWCDYDNDNDLDILLTGNSISKVYRNNGNNTFTQQSGIILQGVAYSSAAWGDFDNDGYSDILITGTTNGAASGAVTKFYRNNGDNTFTEQTGISLTGVYNSSVACGDYNKDGKLDILLTGSNVNGQSVSKLYANFCQSTRTNPPVPEPVSTEFSDSSLVFKWKRIKLGGITYNIRIGDSPEANNLMTSMSHPSGTRLVPRYGNAGSDTIFELRNPWRANYYWSVQAVDNRFAGGEFSQPQNYNFGNWIQASYLFAGDVQGSRLTLNWTRGNGNECMVFAKKGNSGTAQPVNGIPYDANSKFGSGMQIDTSGWYCIYSGSGNNVTVTNLDGLTEYIFCVIENDGINSYFNFSGQGNTLVVKTGSFTEQSNISLIGVRNGTVAPGDYDNDGDLDVLVSGNGNSRIYRNMGNNNFAAQNSIILAGISNGSSAWGDYNNDNYIDILITGLTGTGVPVSKIYRNNGNNTFTEQTGINIQGVYNSSVAWGDYDNDGYLDIIITGRTIANDFISAIYRNNRDNTFTEQTGISLQGIYSGSVAWCDYDKDGDMDILLTGFNSNNIPVSRLYRNNGDNTFTEQTGISLNGVANSSVDWGDYDNDGDLDIILSGESGTSIVEYITCLYRNNGNGTFSELTSAVLKGVHSGSVAWGDYDSDGLSDILLTGHSGKIESEYYSAVYRNNGDNTFTEQTGINLLKVYNSSVKWGDYDKDNRLDIFLAGYNPNYGSVTRIYKNHYTRTNIAPSSPAGLSTTSDATSLILSWDIVSGDETPGAGMSYNVRIGTSPGTGNVVSTMALSSGSRLVPALGNAQNDTLFVLKYPQRATYYWSVQGVDNGFAPGPFAAEQSYTFTTPLQASRLFADSIQVSSFTLHWNRGNGSACSVFARKGEGSAAIPTDNTDYISDSNFGSGSQIGTTGWYCVYNGTGNEVKITNLELLTEYSLQVIEYDPGPVYFTQTGQYNPIVVQTNIFSEQTGVNLAGISYGSIAWGDYDNSNYQDILVTGTTSGSNNGAVSKIYRNNGNNTFSDQVVISLPGVAIGSGLWGDYNNDGYPDIFLTGLDINNSPVSKIFRNNGNNTFSEQTDISIAGVRESSAEWTDLNNDGKLDLIITGTSASGEVSKVYRNFGGNVFGEQQGINFPGVTSGSVACADYDNDGFTDILLTGSGLSRIFRNTGNPYTMEFIEQQEIDLPGITKSSAAWSDYDIDGDLDILLAGYDIVANIPVSGIYRNNNGSFEDSGITLAGVAGSSVADNSVAGASETIWGDYDNDGDPDILLTGETVSGRICRIYTNNGNGTFRDQSNFGLPGVRFSAAAWGDYDNDGDLDIVISGEQGTSRIIRIFRNEILSSNSAPEAPSGLGVSASAPNTTLFWTSVRTDETAFPGLTYNIRMGTSAGGNQVISSMSSASGKRRISAMGNSQLDTFLVFQNLRPGTYYWSVQAVDNGFAGGAYAEEKSFAIDSLQASRLEGKLLATNKNALQIKWKNGNGERRVVFCKQGSTGIAVPAANATYSADNLFGYGDQIGTTGWYCVFNGRGDSTTVTGLTQGVPYSFHVIEYVGNTGSEVYYRLSGENNPGIFSCGLFSEQTEITLD